MFKDMKKGAALLATCFAMAVPAYAGVEFGAGFLEVGGPMDLDSDDFTFGLTQTGPAVYDIDITYIEVDTVDSPEAIIFDLSDSSFVEAGVLPSAIGIIPDPDGNSDSSLVFDFRFAPFGVGDFYEISVDVDDADTIVEGTSGMSNFAGSLVFVEYLDIGVLRTAEFFYGECDPAIPDICASAGGRLLATAVPAPGAIALLGLGLVGAGLRRRR